MITLQHQEVLKIQTKGKQIHDITEQIQVEMACYASCCALKLYFETFLRIFEG